MCSSDLQVFYSVRSERMLMEQTRYNLLFRWFIGLAIEDAVWVPTVFTKSSMIAWCSIKRSRFLVNTVAPRRHPRWQAL